VWIDKPEYYNPPSGLLTFSMTVPDELVHPPGGMTARGHVALIKHQLAQIKQALALSFTLGRKLIFPRVTCGYDKAWYPLASGQARGVFPGSHAFILPIRDCPIDHYLEVGMLRPYEYIREYSLLGNPRTPRAVLSSVKSVALDMSSSASEVARLSRDFSDVKVLNVTNVASVDVASNILTAVQSRKFTSQFRSAHGSWCCAPQEDRKKGMPNSAHFSLLR